MFDLINKIVDTTEEVISEGVEETPKLAVKVVTAPVRIAERGFDAIEDMLGW